MKDAVRDDKRMVVDIWADVSCPFCYLGKRRFEAALERFPQKGRIEIIWHSFQLDPAMKGGAGEDLYGYVARIMGQSRAWSVGYHDQIAAAARQAGLEYNFGAVVPCNTFDAHRLIHLAKKHGLGDEAEERLFRAYFTEGRDLGDHDTLIALGKEIGLDAKEAGKMLKNGAYADAVRKDVAEAEERKIEGVPFFLLDHKHAVIGAQQPSSFLRALEAAFSGWAGKKH